MVSSPLNMRPPHSALNLSDVGGVDTVIEPDQSVRSWVGANCQHLSRRKPGLLVALAILVVGVVHPFGNVRFACRPTQMARVDAARDAAAVGGIMARGWVAVRQHADDPVNLTSAARETHLRVSAGVHGERPQEALIGFQKQSVGEDIFARHALYSRGV
jgi:hypothetical protein